MVGFFQFFGEPSETFGQKQPRRQSSPRAYLFSQPLCRRLHFNLEGDSSVLSGRCASMFQTEQETHFVVSHSKKCLMGFGALALLCGWGITTAPSASVQAHQFAPACSSFPQTVLLFLPRLAAQHSCITRKRAGLSFGEFFA